MSCYLAMRASLVAAWLISASAQVTRSFNTTSSSAAGSNETESTSTSTIFSTTRILVSVPPPNSTAPTGNGTSLPTTGTGAEYASSCNAAKVSWVEKGGHDVISTSTFTTATLSPTADISYSIDTLTSLAPGATPYALCDGYPRLNGTTSVSVITSSTRYNVTETYTTSKPIYRNITAPTCTIASDDCVALNSTYIQQKSAYVSWFIASNDASFSSQPFTTPAPISPDPDHYPICGAATLDPPRLTTLIPPACIVNTAHVQLYYWPVITAANCSLCGTALCATQTLGPTISGQPNTIVTLNTTLTSPTVYIAITGDYVYQSNSQTIKDSKLLVFPQTAASVSSLRGKIGGGFGGQAYPFNYADLNLPVPADAYRGQPKCFTNPEYFGTITTTYTASNGDILTTTSVGPENNPSVNLCSTIWNDYNPALSIPPELSSLSIAEGDGAKCNFTVMENGVLFDPPIALTQAAAVVKPTAPAGGGIAQPTVENPTPTAQPGNVPGPGTPRPTAQPDPLPTPDPPPQNPSPQDQGNVKEPQSPSAQPAPQGSPNKAPANQDQAPAAQPPLPSSQNVGDVIASIIGANPQGNAPAAPSNAPAPSNGPAASPTNALEALTALPDGPAPSPNNPAASPNTPAAPVSGSGQSDDADPGKAPANGAVIGGSNNQEVTVMKAPSNGGVVVGGATLAPGQSTSVEGMGKVVAQTAGVVVNGQSHAFSALGSPASPNPPAANGAVVQGNSEQAVTILQPSGGNVVIGSNTLPVGATISISGVGNVVAQSNGIVVNGESTVPFTAVQGGGTNGPTPAVISVGDGTITAATNGGFVVAPGQTLTPGGQVTVSGTTFSLDHAGSSVVINGVTHSVQHDSASQSGGTSPTTTTSVARASDAPTTPDNAGSPTQTAGTSMQRSLSVSVAALLPLLVWVAMV